MPGVAIVICTGSSESVITPPRTAYANLNGNLQVQLSLIRQTCLVSNHHVSAGGDAQPIVCPAHWDAAPASRRLFNLLLRPRQAEVGVRMQFSMIWPVMEGIPSSRHLSLGCSPLYVSLVPFSMRISLVLPRLPRSHIGLAATMGSKYHGGPG